MKFKLSQGKGCVSGFTLGNVTYRPGDIVDLPQSYEGETWLERVDPIPVVTPPPQKITPIIESAKPAVVAEPEPAATNTVEAPTEAKPATSTAWKKKTTT